MLASALYSDLMSYVLLLHRTGDFSPVKDVSKALSCGP